MTLAKRQVVTAVGLVGALVGFGVGCFMDHDPGSTGSGLTVGASISSASLADDCASSGLADGAGRCAPDAPCPSFCQQSQMQLLLEAGDDGTEAVTIEVMEVRLIDAATGRVLQNLTPREPQKWVSDFYQPWDGLIAPSEELQASFKLSAPDWATIGGGEPWGTYGMRFKIQVRLRVDGVDRMIESAEISRDPEVAT
jgi:hypothetical protein